VIELRGSPSGPTHVHLEPSRREDGERSPPDGRAEG
jgi:hypothetical protein